VLELDPRRKEYQLNLAKQKEGERELGAMK
jgi:hypothetical protein